MSKERVVITGMGAVSPYGEGVRALTAGLDAGICALSPMPAHTVEGVHCRAVGLAPAVNAQRIPRELRRAMSPMSLFACLAAREALMQAGLVRGDEPWGGGGESQNSLSRMGVAVGSTLGSPQTLNDFFTEFLTENSVDSVRTTVFFKAMGHTAASNVAAACGCTGRILAPAAACASGLMGLGLGYESIAAGREQRMLCGGADEFHLLVAATFDRMGAASHEADLARASRPFDVSRSGLVCGEGAGILLLESLSSAQARQATILAEIKGFAVRNSTNIAQPDTRSIGLCMAEALDDAKLDPTDLAGVSAHATATKQGDEAEGQAIAALIGKAIPTHSLKGHMGHVMAACGALESIACLHMLHSGLMLPTLGLSQPDPACGDLLLPRRAMPLTKNRHGHTPLLKNCFALGGCVCSMVLDTYSQA